MNVELRVGQIEETITVSGASPLVDVQNVVQQKVLTRDLLDVVPTNKSLLGFAAFVPGDHRADHGAGRRRQQG